MTIKTAIKMYKIYMNKGLVEQAKAIFPQGLPEELRETKKEAKK